MSKSIYVCLHVWKLPRGRQKKPVRRQCSLCGKVQVLSTMLAGSWQDLTVEELRQMRLRRT